MILEALRELRAMGCLTAFVGGQRTGPDALYVAVIGPAQHVPERWERPD